MRTMQFDAARRGLSQIADEDPTEESAGNSESYHGGPCRDRTYDRSRPDSNATGGRKSAMFGPSFATPSGRFG